MRHFTMTPVKINDGYILSGSKEEADAKRAEIIGLTKTNGETSTHLNGRTGLKMDADNFYFLQGVSKRNLIRLPKTGGEPVPVAKEASRFWLGENDLVFTRDIGVSGTALFKVTKTAENETELDRNGFIADLVVGKNKIYLSDIIKIFEL